ncbi:MAG: beta-lactamase class [Sphingomonadales bacterium]|jgi:beta-lactamase class A|nr:beta-lactamase class [Sphingomonadales bacterium]
MTSGARAPLSGLKFLAVIGALAAAGVAQAQSAPVERREAAAAVAAPRELEQRIRELGRAFDGEVGIAVRDIDTGWAIDWHGDRFYPQQSVSKFWVAITALQRADAGELDLNERVTVTRQDLTLFHQPIAGQIGANGYTTTLGDLMFRALTQSDNTCNDIVLRHAGGPAAVRAMLERNRLEGVRFGPGERLLQAGIAGLQWQPAFSQGNAFSQARSSLPAERRRQAFERYIDDPVDGATPNGITNGLVRLQRGELLSPESTERLLDIMAQTHTGRNRLRGGLAPGWTLSHKTGTGQVLGAEQAGYNDIGILHAPDGRNYALAVMIGRTSTPLETRMALMQNVVRATIAHHEASRQSGGGETYRRR